MSVYSSRLRAKVIRTKTTPAKNEPTKHQPPPIDRLNSPPSLPNIPKSRTKLINNLPWPQNRRHLLTPTPILNHLRLTLTPQQPRRIIADPRHQRSVVTVTVAVTVTTAATSSTNETLLRDGVVGLGENGRGFGEGGARRGEGPGGGGGAGVVGGVDRGLWMSVRGCGG